MNFIEKFTEGYRDIGFYSQKKAHYTMAFILIMGLYAVLNSVIEFTINSQLSLFIYTLLGIVLFFTLLLLLLVKGKLLFCQYAFMIIGTVIGLQYMAYSTHFQFYTQMIMVLIVGVTIHIKRTQMITVYVLVNGMVLFRAYYLYTLITLGFIERDMLNQSLQAALGIVVFSAIIAYFNSVLGKEIKETKELGEISVTDTLTHLGNRAGFNQSIAAISEKTHKYGLAILDIDKFKVINDQQGHHKGDLVLIALANLMRDHFKEPYQIFRWGGEEFVVIAKEVELDEMVNNVEVFRKLVEAYDFDLGDVMTISGGLAMAVAGVNHEQVIIDADNALYDAKRQGRNQIMVAAGGNQDE